MAQAYLVTYPIKCRFEHIKDALVDLMESLNIHRVIQQQLLCMKPGTILGIDGFWVRCGFRIHIKTLNMLNKT